MNKPDKTNSQTRSERKPYSQPKLKVYGDIRDLTLAPTPAGFNESGRGFNRQRWTPPPP